MVVHVINVFYLINLFYNSFYDNSYIKIQLEVEGDINSLNLQSCLLCKTQIYLLTQVS